MTFVVEEPRLRSRDVGRKPPAVVEGNHAVLRSLPDGNRHPNALELESPGPGEGEVVVAPSGDARRHRSAERLRQDLGELAREGIPVDLRDQAAKRGRDLPVGDGAKARRSLFEELADRRLAFECGAELVDVLLGHARKPVETGDAVGRDAGYRRGGHTSL